MRDRTLVYYLPLYHYVKLAALLWAFLPQTLVWPWHSLVVHRLLNSLLTRCVRVRVRR